MIKLKLLRREKRIIHYRVSGLAGQNATSTTQGQERYTEYTLYPNLNFPSSL